MGYVDLEDEDELEDKIGDEDECGYDYEPWKMAEYQYQEIAKALADAAAGAERPEAGDAKGCENGHHANKLKVLRKKAEDLSIMSPGSFGIYSATHMPYITDTEERIFFLDLGDNSADGFKKILTLLYECDSLALREAVIITDNWTNDKRKALTQIGYEIAYNMDLRVMLVKDGAARTVAGSDYPDSYEMAYTEWASAQREIKVEAMDFKPIAIAASKFLSGLKDREIDKVLPKVKSRVANRIAMRAGLSPDLISFERSGYEYGPNMVAIYMCKNSSKLDLVIERAAQDAEGVLKGRTKGIIILSSCWEKISRFNPLYLKLEWLENSYRFEFWLSPEMGKATRLRFTRGRARKV